MADPVIQLGTGAAGGGSNGGAVSSSTVISTGSTTARTLANRFAEVVNVKDFGATGDGVTDDSIAINAAIAAATGKVVYFPSGTYILNAINSISVAVSCRLTSDGGAIIKSSGGGLRCIIVSASVVQIDHLTFDCNNDLTRNGITLLGDLTDIVIDSCEIKNFVERGIYSSQNTLTRVTVSNCYVHDGTKAAIALYAHSPLSKSVNDIQVFDNRVANMIPGTGVGIGITVSDVNSGANVQTVNRVQICRNRVRDVERVPIEMQRGSGCLIEGNTVTGAGGTIAGGTFGNNGISAVGCENTVITGNYVADQTNEGIEIGGAVNLGGLIVSNNTIYNCYRGISGASPGSQNTSITGNTFTKTGYVAISGATNPDVIRLVGNDASTAYTNLNIVGNSAYDILNGAFCFVGRAADVNISNNTAEDGASALYGRFIRIQECLRGGVYNNDMRASGTGYASLTSAPIIDILTGSDQLFISGNRCQGIGGSVIQRAGIRSNNVTTSNVWITNNYVTNLAIGIQVNGTSPTSYHILDNQVVGCTTPYTVTQGQTVRAEQTLVPAVTAAGTAKTSNYTIPITETIAYGDATGGAFNFTLPTTPTTGYTCMLRKTDTGANAITIVGTVDGSANPTLTAAAPVRVVSYDGTAWRTLSGAPITTAALPKAYRVLGADCAQHASTALAETVLSTISVSAAVGATITANSIIWIEMAWSMTGSTNSKALRGRIGATGAGTGGTQFFSISTTTATTVAHYRTCKMFVRSPTSQLFINISAFASENLSASAAGTSAIDLSAGFDLVFTGAVAASDTIALEAVAVYCFTP
jgi:hypothetical protein